MKNILIINGHPDASAERLTSALAAAYGEGAEKSQYIVRRIDVGALQFSQLHNATEFAAPPTEWAIIRAQAEFLTADHIVFIFPLWLGGPPALLKAYLEQVARNEFLIQERKGRFPSGALKGRSATVIVTMGMPPLIYRTIFGARGIKAFNQGILRMAGLSPIHTAYFGGADITTPRTKKLIDKVQEMGRRAQ